MSEILKDDLPDVDLSSVLDERGDLSHADALRLVSGVAEIVRDLHRRGRLHGGISTRSVSLEPSTQEPALPPPRPASSFGGAFSDEDHCPLELRRPDAIDVPSDLEAARRTVADAGIALDPRQIDIYQLGTLLCRLVTSKSVSAYLSSPRTKADVPPQVRSLIDRALGYEPDTRFTRVIEFLAAIEQALEHLPTDDSAAVSDRELADARDELPDDGPASSQSDTSPSMALAESQPDTDVDPRRDVGRSSDAELPFRTLGHYQITGRIGHGGMGDVFKAFEKKLNRTVAIKVLPVELAREPDFVKRFYAEASAAANLIHPNIIQITSSARNRDAISLPCNMSMANRWPSTWRGGRGWRPTRRR